MAALALSTGCGRRNPSLLASRGDFPSAWASALPDPWTSRLLEDPAAVLAAAGETSGSAALLQLSDGWALTVPRERLAPIGAAGLLQRLEPRAAAVSRLFLPQGEPALAFPWSSSPWILVLRSRPDVAPGHDHHAPVARVVEQLAQALPADQTGCASKDRRQPRHGTLSAARSAGR